MMVHEQVSLETVLPKHTRVQINGGDAVVIEYENTALGMISTVLTIQGGKVVMEDKINWCDIISLDYAPQEHLLSVCMK